MLSDAETKHLHALCSNWLDSAEWLFPIKLVTDRMRGHKPRGKKCSPQRFCPSASQNPMAADAETFLGVKGRFSLLHSAGVTLPFFN